MEAAEDGAGPFKNPGAQVPAADRSQPHEDVKTETCTSSCKGTSNPVGHVTSVDQEKKPTSNKSGGGLKEEIVEVVIGNYNHGSGSNNECNKEGEADDDSMKEKEFDDDCLGEEEADDDSMKEGAHADDGYLYCEECGTYFYNKCEVHGPPLFTPDTPALMGVEDRARQTLPPGLEVRMSDIPDAGLGVFNVGETVPIGAHFGPYQGEPVDREEAMNSGYSWVICRSSQCEEYIDATNETNANWMRYVNCARNEEEQNLVAFQYQGGIFYRCCRPIKVGQELLMWYQENYAKEIGITFEYLWNKKCFTKEKKDPSFSCPFCPLYFTAQTYLQKHISRCHHKTYLEQQGSEEIGSVCSSTTQVLKTHQRVHTEERPYRCSQCGKSCSNRGNLQRHMLIHTGEKPHQCSHCGKSFSQKTHLEVHQTVHTGARPYPCSVCGKNFTRPSALRKHRLVHVSVKPHRCPQCWKSFTNQSALQTHMNIHSSQKPYQCSQCGNSYTLKSTLQLHQRVHTGEKP